MSEPNKTAEPSGASGGSLAWIPVTERMPKRGDRVLVARRRFEWSNSSHKYRKLKRLAVEPASYLIKGHKGLRFVLSGGDIVDEPVAWMPLPAPPTDAK